MAVLPVTRRAGTVILAMLQPIVEGIVLELVVQPLVLPPRHRVSMGLAVVQVTMKGTVLKIVVVTLVVPIVASAV